MKYNVLVLSIVLYSHVCNSHVHKKKRKPHKAMEGFIVKGVEIEMEQFPWLAQILLMNHMHCGGVVLTGRTVLTAGHCLAGWKTSPFNVHLGSRYLGKGSIYKPCKFYVHENYNEHAEYPYFFDIGLILLSKTIKFSRKIQKARLIPPDINFKQEHLTMAVAGWGYIGSYGSPSEVLKMTRMRYVSHRRCNKTQTNDGVPMPVPSHMFCMIADTWTSDCFGDSGSGVMWGNYLVGIVVTGRDTACGSESLPSMYNDISYFRSWIDRQVNTLEKITVAECERTRKNKLLNYNKRDTFGNKRLRNEIIHDTGNDVMFNWLGIALMPRRVWHKVIK